MKKILNLISIFLIVPLLLIGCSSESTKPVNSNLPKVNSTDNNSENNQKSDSVKSDNKIATNTESNTKEKSVQPKEDKISSNSNDSIKDNNSESTDKKNDLPNNTSSKKNITIVIDPGHSTSNSNERELNSPDSKEMKLKDTSGATGINSNIPEYIITHGIALKLEQILKSEGFNVIITKTKPSTKLSNIERTEIANKNNANLMIRIHCDGVDSPNAHGASMLVPEVKGYITPELAKESYSYGEKIINSYTEYTGIKNRGIVTRSDLTGFNWSKVPIVLIELGFISNPKEDSYLSNKSNYEKIARGIANGINNCF